MLSSKSSRISRTFVRALIVAVVSLLPSLAFADDTSKIIDSQLEVSLSEFLTSENFPDESGYAYGRFHIEDANGNIISLSSVRSVGANQDIPTSKSNYDSMKGDGWNNQWGIYLESNKIYFIKSGIRKDWDQTVEKILHLLFPTSLTASLHKCKFVAEFSSEDLANDGSVDASKIKTFTYKLYTTSGLSSDWTEGLLSGDAKKLSALKFIYNNPTSCTLSLPSSCSAKYLRWMVLDAGGNAIDISSSVLTSTDASYVSKGTDKYLWYNGGQTAGSDARTVTFTVPDATKWSDYKVVCYWANDDSGVEIVTDGNDNSYFLSEPSTLDGSFTWSFFNSTSKTDDRKLNAATDYTGSNTTSLKTLVDGAKVELTLKDKADFILQSLGKSSFSELSNLYVYFNLGKDGYDSKGVNITSNNEFYQCYNKDYWVANFTGDNLSMLPSALNFMLTYEKDWGNDDFTDAYFLISDEAPTLSADGVVTAHPSSFKMKITVDAVKAEDVTLTESSNITSTTTREINSIVGNSDTSVSVSLDATTITEDLKSLEGASNDGNLDNVYLRWYLTDKDGKVVSKQNAMLANTSCIAAENASGTDLGLYWYSGGASSTLSDALKMTLSSELPKSYVTTLSDYNVVCVLTNQPDGIETIGSYVLTEPTSLIAKYVFTFTPTSKMEIIPGETANAKEFVYTYDKGNNYDSFTLSIKNDDFKSVFGKDITNVNETFDAFYIRWYTLDRFGNVLGTVGLQANASSYTAAIGNGMYWYAPKSSDAAKPTMNEIQYKLAPYLSFPGDVKYNQWSDYTVKCVISDQLPTVSNGYATAEPEIKAVFTFKFTDQNDVKFRHYVGYDVEHNGLQSGVTSAYNDNGTQKTHEVDYYYYLQPGESKDLKLPIQNYESNGSNIEPKGYFRWFDWNTDGYPSNIERTSESSLLKVLTNGSENVNDYSGLVAFNLETAQACEKTVGVIYTAPDEAAKADWEGTVIACDVSRYVDGGIGYRKVDGDTETYWDEPTVSIRYKFHIASAQKVADEIRDDILGNKTRTYEDNEYTMLGLMDGQDGHSQTFHLRLSGTSVGQYYFHPVTSSGIKKVISFDDDSMGSGFTSSDFSSDVVKATDTKWYVYDATRKYYAVFNSGTFYEDGQAIDDARFCRLSLNTLNSAEWKSVDGSESTSYTAENAFGGIEVGDVFYVVTYLTDDDGNVCPVADYMCRTMNSAVKTFSQFGDGDTPRTVDYLESHYQTVTDPISFDNDNADMDFSAPTVDNNVSKRPSAWNKRYYGFVYGSQIPNGDNNAGKVTNFTPLHGEYGLYKSARLKDVSMNGVDYDNDGHDDYTWWDATWQDKTLYDRTYSISNGNQYGYFLYTDASDESRILCGREFTGNICPGSTFIVSAALANMTENGHSQFVELQFKLYGVDDNDNRTLLHSFSTCQFGGKGNPMGEWYQLFAKVTLQKSVHSEKYNRFYLSVDNYCPGTEGADYAIDDIRMYHRASMVDVVQDQPICNETDGKMNVNLKLRIPYSSLTSIAQLETTSGDVSKKMYYRIVKSDGTVVKLDYDGLGEAAYGTFTVPNNWDNVAEDSREVVDNENYFVIANKPFSLEMNETYYVSLFIPDGDETPEINDPSWGSSAQTCSVYSDQFTLVVQGVNIYDAEGKIISGLTKSCGAEKVDKYSINVKLHTTDQQIGGAIDLSGVPFDWYAGEPTEFLNAKSDDGTTYLSEVLKTFRAAHPTEGLKEEYSSEANYALLKKYVDEGKLMLLASDSLTQDNFTIKEGEYVFTLIPVKTPVTVGSTIYNICTDPMRATLRVYEDGPKIILGFDDVVYPSTPDYRTLRLGLPQLKALKANGGVLKLPVNSIKIDGGLTEGTLAFDVVNSQTNIVLTGTNDPTYLDNGSLATDKTNVIVATVNGATISSSAKTMDIKFNDDVLTMLHEGYYYDVMFTYERQTEASANVCAGETYFRINVVPEYLTWTPKADGGLNNNWDNDQNWHRSSATELYKTSGYTDYGTGEYQNLTTQNAFVPMAFTKVTIPTPAGAEPSPYLAYLQTMNNGLLTNLSNGEYSATSNIQYDIMMKNSPVSSSSADYECEKFYGNTCEQIYFKPNAELRQQQYLVYDKAWLEKEFEVGKWYILGSPLYGTVAGDMYVPTSNGRQETPAFEDITFNTSDNSRKLYPFSQKAWDKSDVTEYRKDGSTWGAYDYPSGVTTMPETINMESMLWSHAYNDVNYSYAPTYDDASQNSGTGTLTGFAVQAGNEFFPVDNRSTKALVRLPKADDSYTYSGSTLVTTINRTGDRHKMIVAAQTTSSNKGPVNVKLTGNASSDNLYYLTYNPYMATLDMKRFFANADNASALDGTSYWVVTDETVTSGNTSTLAGETDGYVAPMQAFFVKAKASEPVITFTTDMTTEHQIVKGVTNEIEKMTSLLSLNVRNSVGRSNSYVAVKETANEEFDGTEDAELLYDNLFETVPTVYTVASDQAVALNAVPEISWMPLGVVCKGSDEVSLSVDGLSQYDGTLYLYDASAKTYTELTEGEEVSLTSNAHGRYFLTGTKGEGTTNIDSTVSATDVRCYSPQPGLITVTTGRANTLKKVQIYNVNGALISSTAVNGGISSNTKVAGGVYIVKCFVVGNETPVTKKVSVR